MLQLSLLDIASVNIFKEGRDENLFIGRPFYLGYEKANILVSDAWKHRVKGIPQGAFLLAFYDGEQGVEEALLLRALTPTKLPTDSDIVSSMIEYYKEDIDISGRAGNGASSKLDDFTRYEFSFSGLECRILGSFYRVRKMVGGKEQIVTEFGADIENFYSANNYSVYKATDKVLKKIVNQREDEVIAGNENEFRIGSVRYSSSRRFQMDEPDVEVYISPKDFIGKRTALFGMTRTGKSNTVKKIIEATVEISKKAPHKHLSNNAADGIFPFADAGAPTFPVGQIIFDVNGEYANPNLQDEGTAIYELYKDEVTRYSVLEKTGFKVMRVNFFRELEVGFELIRSYLDNKRESVDYVNNFMAVELIDPDKIDNDFSAKNRAGRLKAAYLCCLYKAGFKPPANFKVTFEGNAEINPNVRVGGVDPSRGVSLQDATSWFEWVWKNYKAEFFAKYEEKKGYEWADDDLKNLMIFLSGYKQPEEKNSVSGYKKIRNKELHDLHTNVLDKSFSDEIPELLRKGKIVIVDLSQGSETVQTIYSERICRSIFNEAMSRFVENRPNNFIQFYFEEAHNLFPKKEDKDLSDVYNRLAKEGAKLHLGMAYATQEVSSISSNILKNTQNWFIAHLNNEDEIREIRKYYDFSDFVVSLLRFSAGNDKGFVRMKTYTNPFVVPVQIDRFLAKG